MLNGYKRLLKAVLIATTSVNSLFLHAAGIVPQVSAVLIDAGVGEGTIILRNTENTPALLYSSIEHVEDDTEDLVFVTQPVTRIEPGDKQLIRFIIQHDKPITRQHLKRAIFEGIPGREPSGVSRININIRQNLPLIITPSNLAEKTDPWTLLHWSIDGQSLSVKNDSRYVVRLYENLTVLPQRIELELPASHILPGQSYTLNHPGLAAIDKTSTVRIQPVSTYGFKVAEYNAAIHH